MPTLSGLKITRHLFRLHVVFGLCICCFGGHAQSAQTLDSLESHYQACLDKGENMLLCSQVYYRQMDSVLNLVYRKLYSKLDAAGKTALQKEQRQWLVQRDAVFIKNRKAAYKEVSGQDAEMILLDSNAAFVQQRIMALLRKKQ